MSLKFFLQFLDFKILFLKISQNSFSSYYFLKSSNTHNLSCIRCQKRKENNSYFSWLSHNLSGQINLQLPDKWHCFLYILLTTTHYERWRRNLFSFIINSLEAEAKKDEELCVVYAHHVHKATAVCHLIILTIRRLAAMNSFKIYSLAVSRAFELLKHPNWIICNYNYAE